MAAKKKAAKKAATASTTRRVKAIADPMTKSQMITQISDKTGLTKKDVNGVFDELTEIMEGHLKKRGGAGQFTMPGLFKAVTQKKPATKARKGINPFTGEETTFAAKPARTVVKDRPLKKLKDMAQ